MSPTVAAGQRYRERDGLAVGDDVVFAARALRGRPGWGRLWAPAGGPDVGGVDHRARDRSSWFFERSLFSGNWCSWSRTPGLVPGGQAAPAGHARAEAQFLGQILPLDAGVQDEQDPAQSLAIAIGHSRSALDLLRGRLGQQRLDERP
jgi:L-fuconate dehydratase